MNIADRIDRLWRRLAWWLIRMLLKVAAWLNRQITKGTGPLPQADPATPKPYPRAACPRCGRDVAFKKNGKAWDHKCGIQFSTLPLDGGDVR